MRPGRAGQGLSGALVFGTRPLGTRVGNPNPTLIGAASTCLYDYATPGKTPLGKIRSARATVVNSEGPIRPRKQISKRPPGSVGQRASAQMLLSIVDHVAALAESLEIARAVVGRVVVEMGRRECYPCRS